MHLKQTRNEIKGESERNTYEENQNKVRKKAEGENVFEQLCLLID